MSDKPSDRPSAVLMEAPEGSDLEMLLMELKESEDLAKEYKEKAEQIRKTLLTRASAMALAAGTTRADIRSRYGNYAVTHTKRTVLDSKRLKQEHPEFWVAYSKTTEAWQVRAMRND
jgi:hypothetical protein